MGRLLFERNFDVRHRATHEDPTWWVEDVLPGMGENFHYDLLKAFPYPRAIHWSHIGDLAHYTGTCVQHRLRANIRKFIEQRCIGNALAKFKDLSYEFLEKRDRDNRDHGKEHWRIEVKHGYMIFNFEEEQDSVLFKINFGEYISGIEKRHPSYPEVTEQQIEAAKNSWSSVDWSRA